MKRYLIGQYGGFDKDKFSIDFRKNFYGIEACLFEKESDLNRLKEAQQQFNFQIGVHYPFFKKAYPVRDALITSEDPDLNAQAFQQIEEELIALTDFQPSYVLFHYPKPVILDDRVNWSAWSFGSPLEYVSEKDYSLDALKKRTAFLLEWLTEKSELYGFTPILEFDALNRYIYDQNMLEGLLKKYPKIRLCLDTARLHMQEQLDPYFKAETIFKTYAQFADLIHLSNAQVLDGRIQSHHFPVLPELRSQEGWAPIEAYLKVIRDENPTVKILFEHQSNLITETDLERCYQWVDQLLLGE